MAKRKAWWEEAELELKIVLSPQDLEKALKVLFKERVSPLKSKSSVRYYFDTPQLDLYEDPDSIALRTQDGQMTLKHDLPPRKKMPPGAVYRRECKTGIADCLRPGLDMVDDAYLSPRLDPHRKKPLGLKHLMNIRRRLFNIEAGKRKSKGLVELGFDRGTIHVPAASISQDVVAIEAEAKGGSEQAQYDAIMYAHERIMKIAPSAKIDPSPSKNAQGMELYKRYVLNIK